MVRAPSIECAHYTRLHLLNNIVSNVQRCYRLYRLLSQNTEWTAVPTEDAIAAVSGGLERHIKADRIRSQLGAIRDSCLSCKLARGKKVDDFMQNVGEQRSKGQEDSSEGANSDVA